MNTEQDEQRKVSMKLYIENLGILAHLGTHPEELENVTYRLIEMGRKKAGYFPTLPSADNEDDAKKIIDILKREIGSSENTPETLSSMYHSLYNLAEKYPSYMKDVCLILKEGLKSEKNEDESLWDLYLSISLLIKKQPDLAKDSELLSLMEKRVTEDQTYSDSTTRFCCDVLSNIAVHNPTSAEKVIEVFEKVHFESPKHNIMGLKSAYLDMEAIIKVRPDLGERILDCASRMPSYNDSEDKGMSAWITDRSYCQFIQTVIQLRPDLSLSAYDLLQNNTKEKSFLHYESGQILSTVAQWLDQNRKCENETARFLSQFLTNHVKAHLKIVGYGYEYYESAALKMSSQNAGIMLDGLIEATKEGGNHKTEVYIQTMHKMLNKHPHLLSKVLDGLETITKTKEITQNEVNAIGDICVAISQKKGKILPGVARIVENIRAQHYNLLETQSSALDSISDMSIDVLEEKAHEMQRRLSEYNKMRHENEKLFMGKTANEKGQVEKKHQETANLQIAVAQAMRKRYPKDM